LLPGQTVLMDFDWPPMPGNQQGGFSLRNSLGGAVWIFYVSGNGRYSILTGSVDPGPAFPLSTDEGVHVEFTLVTGTRWSAQITPLGGSAVTETGSLTTTNPGGDVSLSSLAFFTDGLGGPGASNAVYANSIAIVPEPSSAAWLAGTSLLLILRDRRRRRIA
jgi:hypothetical protein